MGLTCLGIKSLSDYTSTSVLATHNQALFFELILGNFELIWLGKFAKIQPKLPLIFSLIRFNVTSFYLPIRISIRRENSIEQR